MGFFGRVLSSVCDKLDDLGRVWTNRHRACVTVDDRDVEDLLDVTIDAEPFGARALGQIDYLDAAAVPACFDPRVPGFHAWQRVG